jgi:serine/threonine protein kinase
MGDIENEIRAIKKLCVEKSHDHIVVVHDLGCMGPNSVVYYVDMELCAMNLEQYIQGSLQIPDLLDWRLPVDADGVQDIISLFEQIMSGVAFIHAEDEVHRDLNPQDGIFFTLRSL